ncbi:glycoside hydrolase family 3 domain containing protein [Grosmannia clavigera kw1407]|uniref:beta-glucosidase n=1 Tax=Grosmannia clavigera (strain kw1407 / UAMH 11150) TaxID=655863 RepID=F0XIN2_GROCL|nr:glycoside hydrolase family 3 domain containing protein [Grosmannia clavigera kw1407]EFX02499.1 glycoside hydrolase family 3 domain containing protein [Grosmannia clavigera kw1407]
MRTGRLLFLGRFVVAAAATQPWLDESLDTELRLQMFLGQLNETQIFAMVQGDTVLDDNGTGVNACIGHISGNETLGMPAICMGDGPAGVGNSMNNVTTFPAPVTAAAARNTTLQYAYGQALAQEHLAKGRNVVLSPTINIVRSPSWGRAAESFSEDAWLTARMAVAQVQGIQSQHALACPKHLAAYNQETNRFGLDPGWTAVDAVVDRRALHELYLPAFKATVQEAAAAANDWGFAGFVVADWYFAHRSTVAAANNGLDLSMPGGSLEDSYGFPAYYGDLLVDAVRNGSVAWSRVRDMAARIWRPMFAVGAVDHPVTGNATAVARTSAHLQIAQQIAEEGMVLLKNRDSLLPLSARNHVTELHGGFVIDSTRVTEPPYDYLARHGAAEGIDFRYAEAFPGTDAYETAPSSMFRELNATYWTTTDFSGPANQTVAIDNITIASYPAALWTAWPDVFSEQYRGLFLPNTTGLYRFSLYGQGDANLTLDGQPIVAMTKQNFGNPVLGSVRLTAGRPVDLRLDFSMGYSLSTGNYGVTLGVDMANATHLTLPAGQDDLVAQVARASAKTLVLLGSNSAVHMPWLHAVDGLLETWYPGQQVGAALERLLYGDVSPSGKLPVTFPGIDDDVSIKNRNAVSLPQIQADLTANFSESLLVGYKWFDQHRVEPLFPFGFGLTYSQFALHDFSVSEAATTNTTFHCHATLANIGNATAKQVVQLYVAYPPHAREPPKLLRGFAKVELAAGTAKAVAIDVAKSDLQIWDDVAEDWALVPGVYEFLVGFSSRDIVARQTVYIG